MAPQGIIIKGSAYPGFLTFIHGNINGFCMIMPTCFKDYDFGITEFILYCHQFYCLFNITVVAIFLFFFVIIVIFTCISIISITIIKLALFICSTLNVIVVLSILPVFVRVTVRYGKTLVSVFQEVSRGSGRDGNKKNISRDNH